MKGKNVNFVYFVFYDWKRIIVFSVVFRFRFVFIYDCSIVFFLKIIFYIRFG